MSRRPTIGLGRSLRRTPGERRGPISHPPGAPFRYDPGRRKESRRSPTESPLLFEVDPQPTEEALTALGGIPLVVQAFRSLGLPQSVKEHVRVKERERGYDEATFVESFVMLNAAGGECLEDFERLRARPRFGGIDGARIPSPAAALKVLVRFHEAERIEAAQEQRLPGADRLYPGREAAL